MSDRGVQLERSVKELFLTLDKTYAPPMSPEQYSQTLLPQLKMNSPVILNGTPIPGKHAFQQLWVKFPNTQHNVTSLDFHIIPGTNTLIANVAGKVRFDESGKTRLGETADIDVGLPVGPAASTGGSSNRPIWGSWFGFNANLILDEGSFNNINAELINSLNWKIVFKPEDAATVV